MGGPETPTIVARLAGPLLGWWADHGRDLPWRRTRDPWAVLVSETMLQQTQVPRVVDRWPRFLDRFPTPRACSSAGPAAVVDEWAGLGYNRRAVHLHRAATLCVREFDGNVPDTVADLRRLPGVGPYTARAVQVFAREHDMGLVDTNAGRFLSRAVAGRRLGPSEAQAVADAVVPPGCGWRWGQAVFDLGALVCTKRAPGCGDCPVRRWCAWAVAGHRSPDPIEDSAGISRPQSRFDGSDRQGRGRLVDALRRSTVAEADLAAAMGWPDDPTRARRVAQGLITDGLAERAGDRWSLPST